MGQWTEQVKARMFRRCDEAGFQTTSVDWRIVQVSKPLRLGAMLNPP
jgi:hypothetical protein